MAGADGKPIVLGFLTVREVSPSTWRGAYLLTTGYGRPIEFHYTAELTLGPLQRALFGEEAERFAHADLLAKPMTDRQSTAPRLIVVDRESLLELRRSIPAPVILAKSKEMDPEVLAGFEDDQLAFRKILELTPPRFDWSEPFERLERAFAELPVEEVRRAA